MQKIFTIIVCLFFTPVLVFASEDTRSRASEKLNKRERRDQEDVVRHLSNIKLPDKDGVGLFLNGDEELVPVPMSLSDWAYVGDSGPSRNISGGIMQGEEKQDS